MTAETSGERPETRAGKPAAEFAPADITDGKGLGEWTSSYPPEAWRRIKIEAWFLSALQAVCGLLVLYVICCPAAGWTRLSGLDHYLLALLGGITGGTLFAMKWLYHSVAKRLWHID